MSARDAFLEAYSDPGRCLCGGGSPCESIDSLLDTFARDHAHELAERIRVVDGDFRGRWGKDMTAKRAANLIDPKVEA